MRYCARTQHADAQVAAAPSAAGGAKPSSRDSQIVDPNDNEVARGAVGEIRRRVPNTMLGYWNNPQEICDYIARRLSTPATLALWTRTASSPSPTASKT